MNTKLLSISLAMITSMLVACGGGDARSPDRPNPKLDPSTLRIDFPRGNKLAGLGTNKAEDGILARMVGLQTDGVEVNLGPELNVTEGTRWSITGPIGDPAIAGLAAAVRNATSFGKVKDILSTDFLAEPKGTITLTLNGSYTFEGRTYTATPVEFLVVPPKRVPPPSIVGPEIIAIDPLDADAIAMADYRLVNKLLGLAMLENRTGEAKFCAFESFFTFGGYLEDQSAATATITNPFDSTSNQEAIRVIISAIDPASECSSLYDGDPDTNPATLFAVKTVIIQPASVKSVDVCVITNPAALTCNSNGDLADVDLLNSCQGLDSANLAITSATVPAASRLQMVAKLHYENPANIDQSFNRYQCRGANLLAWSSTPTTVYSAGTDGNTDLHPTDGTATLIGQLAYNVIRNDAPSTMVTASYNNSSTSTITGDLKLNLSDDTVTDIDILPKVGLATDDKKYSINLSFLESDKAFTAICTYASGQAPCGSGTVSWTVGQVDTLKVNPLIGSETTAMPTTPNNPIFGSSGLTATYKASDISHTVTVTIVDNALVELKLLEQDADGNDVEDEFSCLGSGNYSADGSQENMSFEAGAAKGSRRFYAKAAFESDPTSFVDVTTNPAIVFTADVGYYDSANKQCVTTPQSGDIPYPTDEISAGKPAEFRADKKGLLEAQGLARFSTMCVRVFADSNNNQKFDAGTIDKLSSNGASTLVQPAGTLALTEQSGSACAIYDGINDNGGGDLLPALFELGYYADPILANLNPDDATLEIINSVLSSGGAPNPEQLVAAVQTGAAACAVSEAKFQEYFTNADQTTVLAEIEAGLTAQQCQDAFQIL
jgi:hypothetical protein